MPVSDAPHLLVVSELIVDVTVDQLPEENLCRVGAQGPGYVQQRGPPLLRAVGARTVVEEIGKGVFFAEQGG